MNVRASLHTQAGKLDEPERLKWLPPSDVMAALDVHSEMAVVDVGAAFRLQTGWGFRGCLRGGFATGNAGLLKKKLFSGKKLCKIELLQGKADCASLPDQSADLVLLANIWHELDSLEAVLRETRRLLKSGGRLAILDWWADSQAAWVRRRSAVYPMLQFVTCSARRAGYFLEIIPRSTPVKHEVCPRHPGGCPCTCAMGKIASEA